MPIWSFVSGAHTAFGADVLEGPRYFADAFHVILSMPPDAREVRELLWQEEPHAYTYRFVGNTATARNYYWTTRVEAIDAARSRIELRSEFDPLEGVTDVEASSNTMKVLSGNMRAMKRALGLR